MSNKNYKREKVIYASKKERDKLKDKTKLSSKRDEFKTKGD